MCFENLLLELSTRDLKVPGPSPDDATISTRIFPSRRKFFSGKESWSLDQYFLPLKSNRHIPCPKKFTAPGFLDFSCVAHE
jgi:hypothetical protein